METVLQCIFRACFEETAREGAGRNGSPSQPPVSRRMTRSLSGGDVAEYVPAEIEEGSGDAGLIDEGVVMSASDEEVSRNRWQHLVVGGMPGFLARLGFRKEGGYGSLGDEVSSPAGRSSIDSHSRTSEMMTPPRSASSYDYDAKVRSIPAIQLHEIVMPGSDLQKQMSAVMAKDIEAADFEDECVICMEGFSAENPRMPTVCGCGENRTYFHLPCLYQWIDQNMDCPSCRKRLDWQEF